MKKVLSLILILCCVFGMLSTKTIAAPPGNNPSGLANALYEFGLFKGSGVNVDGKPIFSLDEVPTRQQAIVMLVRLLGKEKEAISCTDPHPFTDVDIWADRYIAYAYKNGLANGINATMFGSNQNIDAQQYITLLLRALGYDDSQGDFSYDEALKFSDNIGMTVGIYQKNATFLRGDLVWLSCCALLQNMKSSDVPLVLQLYDDGVMTKEQYDAGLTIMMLVDVWEQRRYINISDTSGAVNYVVDSYDLYTIAGTGQQEGYFRLMGYQEQDTYPIYYRMVNTRDGLDVEGRLMKVPGQNPIRYQNYMDSFASQMACRNYSIENNTIAWSLDESCPIPEIYFTLFNPDEILGVNAEREYWVSEYELRQISGEQDFMFDQMPEPDGTGIYQFIIGGIVVKEFYLVDEMPQSFATLDNAIGTYNGIDFKRENGEWFFDFNDLVEVGIFNQDGTLNES